MPPQQPLKHLLSRNASAHLRTSDRLLAHIFAKVDLIGKETERGWEQNDDISTLMPYLVRYGSDTGIADEQLRKRLLEMPLAFLEFETGLSRNTIVRARRGQPVRVRFLRLLKNVIHNVSIQK